MELNTVHLDDMMRACCIDSKKEPGNATLTGVEKKMTEPPPRMAELNIDTARTLGRQNTSTHRLSRFPPNRRL
jgi:hypothetical protein